MDLKERIRVMIEEENLTPEEVAKALCISIEDVHNAYNKSHENDE